MMKPRALLLAFSLTLLTGCAGGPGPIHDPRKWLDAQEGPKLEGVNGTLLKAAQEAETSGEYRAAANFYQQLADKNPENKEYRVAFADALRKAGDSDRAVMVYDSLLAADGHFAPAVEGKALALMQKGEFDNATLLFNGLVTSNKGSWRTYNALGIVVASRQSPANARQYFDEALRQSPNNPSVLNNIGLSQAMARDFNAAIATLTQASGLSSPKPAFRRQIDLNAAMVYAAAGRLDSAEAIARQYFDGPALHNNMGFYAHLAKDENLAKTYLNMALTQSKRFYPRAWENLQALNGPQPARPQSESTLALPDQPPAPPVEESAAKAAVKDEAAQTPPPTMGYLSMPAPPPAAPQAMTAPQDSTMLPVVSVTAPQAAQLAPAAGVPASPAPPPAPANAAAPKTAESGFEAIGNWVGSLLDY